MNHDPRWQLPHNIAQKGKTTSAHLIFGLMIGAAREPVQ